MKGKTEICPVCDMSVEVDDTTPTSEYKNQTYSFCGSGCKQKFDRDPDKYAVGMGSMQEKSRATNV